MKINFTKKQYRSLIDLIHLGDMVVNGIRTDDTVEEYEELREYIYSFAKQMGQEDNIKYDKEYDMHFETREYESGKVQEYIEDYDDEIFWTELASRLATRDTQKLIMLTGEISDKDEDLKKYWSREDIYQKEFEENGLRNVVVDFKKVKKS
ncbi:hypothetical protein [Alkalibacterium sp. 20]|uniref:hypothetical protein n=1 Tax=Alkalibacterium sp. 20 TaxID=1798803 RepID=UPI0009000E4B|nr:hypothetical protein [Alkalibacterium sp. 20]OJF94646.1 hypothetical protein AX762_01920 [Alkalibacterium sp. 20]